MMVAFVLLAALLSPPGAETTGLDRAIAFLSREVPQWSKKNHCYSCHNNGDAARALYTAKRLGYKVPESALASTTEWVSHPEKWDSNRGNPAFSDKGLARIQFAAALGEAIDAQVVR